MGQVTSLLSAIGHGERAALGELYELLYPELHRLAHSRVRRSGDLTLLDTTSLVQSRICASKNPAPWRSATAPSSWPMRPV